MDELDSNDTFISTTSSSFDFFNSDAALDYLEKLHGQHRQEPFHLDRVSSNIHKYYIIVLAVIGVPSNVLTVATILSMHALSPATFFVVLLAIFDGSALLIKLFGQQLAQYEMHNYAWFCKGLNPLSIFFSTTANWVLVLICLERFISVCYPLKKAYLFTKRRSFISAAILIGSLFSLIMTTLGVTQIFYKGRCTTQGRFRWFYDNVWPYLNVALHLFVPFVFIAILTAFIIHGLRRSKKHRMSLMRKSEGNDEEMKVLKKICHDDDVAPRKSRSVIAAVTPTVLHNQRMLDNTARVERTITLMLIAAGVLFLVLSLPMSLFYLIHGFKELRENSVERARWTLYQQFAYVFIDSTHAVNFFLYFFTAKRFRVQLIRIVSGRASCWGRRIVRRGHRAGSNGNRADNGPGSKIATFHSTTSTCVNSTGPRGSSVYYPSISE